MLPSYMILYLVASCILILMSKMAVASSFCSSFFVLAALYAHLSASLELPPRFQGESISDYCQSFQINAEASNIHRWIVPDECVSFVRRYMTGLRYLEDVRFMAEYAIEHAESINVQEDRGDSWVFDVDETLLSNVEYFTKHNFGASTFNRTDFNLWIASGKSTPIVPMRTLYRKLIKANWTVFLISQMRTESQRSITEKNLRQAGYWGWTKLFLSAPRPRTLEGGYVYNVSESGNKDAYNEITTAGYRVQATIGDNPDTDRNPDPLPGSLEFKSPNPMYNID